jgi:hypothetical protein
MRGGPYGFHLGAKTSRRVFGIFGGPNIPWLTQIDRLAKHPVPSLHLAAGETVEHLIRKHGDAGTKTNPRVKGDLLQQFSLVPQ